MSLVFDCLRIAGGEAKDCTLKASWQFEPGLNIENTTEK